MEEERGDRYEKDLSKSFCDRCDASDCFEPWFIGYFHRFFVRRGPARTGVQRLFCFLDLCCICVYLQFEILYDRCDHLSGERIQEGRSHIQFRTCSRSFRRDPFGYLHWRWTWTCCQYHHLVFLLFGDVHPGACVCHPAYQIQTYPALRVDTSGVHPYAHGVRVDTGWAVRPM